MVTHLRIYLVVSANEENPNSYQFRKNSQAFRVINGTCGGVTVEARKKVSTYRLAKGKSTTSQGSDQIRNHHLSWTPQLLLVMTVNVISLLVVGILDLTVDWQTKSQPSWKA